MLIHPRKERKLHLRQWLSTLSEHQILLKQSVELYYHISDLGSVGGAWEFEL